MSQFGLAVRHWAGKQKDLGSIPLGAHLFSSKRVVVCGRCLVTLSLTVIELMKRSNGSHRCPP